MSRSSRGSLSSPLAAVLAALAAACGSAGGFRFDGSSGGTDGAVADAAPAGDAAGFADAEPGLDLAPGQDAPPLVDAEPAADAEPAGDAEPGADVAPADAEPAADAEPGDAVANPDALPADTGPAGDAGVSPSPTMSFFATSQGSGASGGDFGGLAGADLRCQTLATAAGAGARTWQAYLSISEKYPPGIIIHAKDRIGSGPWFNYYGAMIAAGVAALHMNGVDSTLVYTELGTMVPMNDHDIMTGSDELGEYRYGDTCGNWTDSTDGPESFGFVGHSDWSLPPSIGNRSWNSSHRTAGCSAVALFNTAGSGRIYCFAIN